VFLFSRAKRKRQNSPCSKLCKVLNEMNVQKLQLFLVSPLRYSQALRLSEASSEVSVNEFLVSPLRFSE